MTKTETSTPITEIKHLHKAAELLADFDMRDYAHEAIHYCEVGIYFKDLSANQVFSDTNINVTDEVSDWQTADWEQFIVGEAYNFSEKSNFSPDAVASVVVAFKLRPTSKSIYRLECTNLSQVDSFNRFFATNASKHSKVHHELYLTTEQRAEIHSVDDAVELAESLHEHFSPVKSDLPWICKYGNGDLVF